MNVICWQVAEASADFYRVENKDNLMCLCVCVCVLPGQSRIHVSWWHELGVLSLCRWFWGNQPLEMCDLYFLSSFIWKRGPWFVPVWISLSFPLSYYSLLTQHYFTAVSLFFWLIHCCNALISQVVWSSGLNMHCLVIILLGFGKDTINFYSTSSSTSSILIIPLLSSFYFFPLALV